MFEHRISRHINTDYQNKNWRNWSKEYRTLGNWKLEQRISEDIIYNIETFQYRILEPNMLGHCYIDHKNVTYQNIN